MGKSKDTNSKERKQRKDTTITVRVRIDVHAEAMKMMDQESLRHTTVSDAITISDSAWLSYLIKLGLKVHVSNRKLNKK